MLPIDLKEKVAIVTGAARGIGLGIAEMMAKAGCHVAACGLEDAESEEVLRFVQLVEENDVDAFYMQRDLKVENEINSFVNGVKIRFGRIDFLISNAGINMFDTPESCEDSFWNDNMDINLKSHWLLAKASYKQLKENKGAIVFISSNHAESTIPGCFPYNVAKAGLNGLVNALTVQWGKDIRVVGLAPGFIETEGGKAWFKTFDHPEEKRREIVNIHPVKKLGTTKEIGAFCAFLCSSYAGFISGTTYLVDGGRSSLMHDI